MKYVKDLLDIFCEFYDNDQRCRITFPGDSRTYILEDCNPAFDYESEKYGNNIELVLVDSETLVSIRREIHPSYRILIDGHDIRIIDDRIEEQVSRIFEEARLARVRAVFVCENDLGVFDWVEPRVIDRDHSIVILEARERDTQTLSILVFTEATRLTELNSYRYEITGEYFVNHTSRRAPNI